MKARVYLYDVFGERLGLGKFDVEFNVQIALLERVAINRHALIWYGSYGAGWEYFALLLGQHEIACIQMFDNHFESTQRLGYVDRVLHEEIVVYAWENLVLLHLQDDDQVTGFGTRLSYQDVIIYMQVRL